MFCFLKQLTNAFLPALHLVPTVKMKSAVAATLIGSAAAFAPAQTGKISTALNGDARSPDGLGVDPGPLDLWSYGGY